MGHEPRVCRDLPRNPEMLARRLLAAPKAVSLLGRTPQHQCKGCRTRDAGSRSPYQALCIPVENLHIGDCSCLHSFYWSMRVLLVHEELCCDHSLFVCLSNVVALSQLNDSTPYSEKVLNHASQVQCTHFVMRRMRADLVVPMLLWRSPTHRISREPSFFASMIGAR